MAVSDEVNELLREADEAWAAGRLDDAAAALGRARQQDPESIGVLLLFAALLQRMGDWQPSKELAFEVLRREPDNPHAFSLLGYAHRELGEFREQLDALSRACELAPNAGGYTAAGDAAVRLGEEDLAERCFRRALALDGKYEEAAYNLAVLLRISRPDEAEVLLRQVVELDPNCAAAHRELGFVLCRQGRFNASGKALNRSLRLEDSARTRVYLATLYWRTGRTEMAVSEDRRAHDMDPKSKILKSLAETHERHGAIAEATDFLRRARSVK